MKKIIFLLLISFMGAIGQDNAGELTLDQCVRMALSANTTILQNRLNVRQSEIAVNGAASALLPTASLSSSAATSKSDGAGSAWASDWRLSASINQSLYQPGLYTGISLAKLNQETTRLTVEESKSQIITAVHRLYFQILTSRDLITVYRENLLNSDQNLEKIRYMYQVGAKTESDVLKAEVQRGDIQSSLLSEEQNLRALKRDMDILLGRTPTGEFALAPVATDNLDIPEWSVARQLVLEKNWSYQAVKKNIQAQTLSVKMAKESYLPSLSGSYGYSKGGDFDGYTSPAGHSLSIRASLDLFDGLRKHRTIQLEQVARERLALELQEKERQLTQDLLSVYQNIETLNQLIALNEKTVRSAQRDLQLVSERYAMGGSTILDQTTAQAALIRTQTELVRVQYYRKIAEAQVKQMLALL